MKMVSVIIPVYNSEKTIEKCLDSLFSQTYRDFECVIINDESTDNSLLIIERYKDFHHLENLRIISVENHGQGYARNLGIQQSKGDFICFVDSDDTVKEKYLENMLEKMDDETDMVVGQIERCFEYKPSLLEKSFKYSEELKLFYHETIEAKPELMLEVINAPYAKLIRKNFLIDHKIFFPEGIIYEDMVFTHKIMSYRAKITSCTEKDYLYAVRKGSTMTGNKRIEDIFDAMDQVIENYSKIQVDKEYLDYFIFHHVCIGGMYRVMKMESKKALSFVRLGRNYLNFYQCELTHNHILENRSSIIQLFSRIFV